MQLALVDGRLFVAVQEFDGVLDGEDVVGLVRVHLVENSGERGRFSGSRWASDQHDAIPQVDNFLQCCGEMQFVKSRDFVRDDAHYDGAAAALPENVHAEASHSRKSV